MSCMSLVIGASLSEPHIDELNVRNLYIIIMVRPSPARRHIHCMQCAIYSRGRMKKLLRSPVPRAQSLLSQQNRYTQPAALQKHVSLAGLARETTCCLWLEPVSRDKAKWLQTLVMLPLYLECPSLAIC